MHGASVYQDDVCVFVAKPRVVRPLMSHNVSESDLNKPVSFHCVPVPAVTSTSSSDDTLITWYINAQPLTGQYSWYCLLATRQYVLLSCYACLSAQEAHKPLHAEIDVN